VTFLVNSSVFEVTDSLFAKNSALEGPGGHKDQVGGVVILEESSEFRATSSRFLENTAYVQSSVLVVLQALFVMILQAAGVAFVKEASRFLATTSEFGDNTAENVSVCSKDRSYTL